MSFAVASLSGRLVRDPDTKEIGSGTVTSFTVACDQYNGKGKDKTPQYWDCECWSPAQAVLKFFRKGDRISISGPLRQDKRENDKGVRVFYKIRVEQIGTLPPKDSSAPSPSPNDNVDDPF